WDRIRANAHELRDGFDFVFVHDPQPAALSTVLEEDGRLTGRWLWRCHIDLLSAKNIPLSDETTRKVLAGYGIDPDRPIVTQVSRFDPWKDPLGVIDAYSVARERVPGLQLVMAGSLAHDDPEGMRYLELTEQHRDGEPDIHLLTNLQEVGNVEVNAFQRAAEVVVQKSVREGFGLVVAEGMWK